MSNASNADADVLTMAERWLAAGKAAALATAVDTWSSAPLPAGSQMIVDADGVSHGSLSSGCIEREVVAAAIDVIASGKARLVEFRVSDNTARAAGLACGGRIEVYIETIS